MLKELKTHKQISHKIMDTNSTHSTNCFTLSLNNQWKSGDGVIYENFKLRNTSPTKTETHLQPKADIRSKSPAETKENLLRTNTTASTKETYLTSQDKDISTPHILLSEPSVQSPGRFSNARFYKWPKKIPTSDNMNKLENLIEDLNVNLVEKLKKEILMKQKQKEELEDNIAQVESQLSVASTDLTKTRIISMNMSVAGTKDEFVNDRLQRQLYHLGNEIPDIKKQIAEMKREMERKAKETKDMNCESERIVAEMEAMREEAKKIPPMNEDVTKVKKCMMTGIVLLKKKADELKEKVIREANRSDQFVSDVSIMVAKIK